MKMEVIKLKMERGAAMDKNYKNEISVKDGCLEYNCKEYKIIDECGVPHNKTFIISILIDGKEMGVGKGKNKKEAEQAASKQAMKKLKIQKY